MSNEITLIERLTTLNEIAATLNSAVDVQSALNSVLARLVELMGLQTGWIFLLASNAQERWWGKGYVLAAYHNLPPALDLESASAWDGGCDCQGYCSKGKLTEAYNEVRCSRLIESDGDTRGLVVHASAPLRIGEQTLGILNVAASDWSEFNEESLTILNSVGNIIAAAIERARLFDMLREQRIHEQAVLLEFSNQLLSRSELQDLMNYLVIEVSRLLGFDACALLLPSEDPAWLAFKAVSGWISDPVYERRLLPNDDRTGPGRAMHKQQPVVVEDIWENEYPTFRADWLAAEGFRGHVIVPLIIDGRSIGALVLDMRHTYQMDTDKLRFLRLMANQAAIAIEKARLLQQEAEGRRMEEELTLARQIQLSLLPDACPIIEGWEFCSYYQAARQIGGDFYDFFWLAGEQKRLGMVIGDVAGKGVPAALFMSMSRTIMRSVASSGRRPPAEALVRANEVIITDAKSDVFLTAFYGVLYPVEARVVFANAGHNPPLWWRAEHGAFQTLKAKGIVLGMFENIHLEEAEITMQPGDMLICYTDGVTEAMDAAGDLFGEARLRAAVESTANGSADAVLNAIVEAVTQFTGELPQSDDLTIFIMKRQP
ncbi:MAG: SpoIIE family protein phosphatase [Chloroflexi bacterium]|nr:SpoIIE family protein phosphatase [Chloroflexota bacterium]